MAVKNRQPAAIERVGGLNKREQIWAKVRELKQFSVCEAHTQLEGITKASIHHYMQCLLAGEFVEVLADSKPAVYQLIKDCGVQAPRLRKDGSVVTQGRGNENLWRTMKILKVFNWEQLACVASLPELVIKPATAKRYVMALYHAGYLTCIRESQPGVKAVYCFNPSMSTGGRAPLIQRNGDLYDPNLGRIVPRRTA